ncbi:MAG: GTP-binding protein [Desulfobulbaceae bacterium]|jgi:elongation factor G|nr:GTP-binding protein [Desulfobulbaceae bacterium]
MGAAITTRNIILLGHSKCGKTTLAKAILKQAGEEQQLLDHDPESMRHHMTTTSCHVSFPWNNTQIMLTDTPGDENFIHEAQVLAHVSDNAILTICANESHHFQTEKAAALIQQSTMPSILFINKMDTEDADFNGTIKAIRTNILLDPAVLYLPIGSGASFSGIVDVINEQAYYFTAPDEAREIPPELKKDAYLALGHLMEQVAETDDDLIEELLEEGELEKSALITGLRRGVASGALSPVLPGSASQDKSTYFLMQIMSELFPPAKSHDQPLSCQIFKVDHNPEYGVQYYCKINAGTLTPGTIFNNTRNVEETIRSLHIPQANELLATDIVPAGMFAIITDLSSSGPGDTLTGSPQTSLLHEELPPIARACATCAVTSKSTDTETMFTVLAKMMSEDHALHLTQEPSTGETLISGGGRLHLDVAIERIKRKFGVELELTLPRIPYQQQDDTGKEDKILLEPVMKLNVTIPVDCVGEVITDLGRRRGKIMEMRSESRDEMIIAHVPMAEILEYGAELADMTGGRGNFKALFSHYEKTDGERP